MILLAAMLSLAPAMADEPVRLSLDLPQASEPPCSGRLELGAPPCRFFAVLGTQAMILAADMIRPADARLTRVSDISPRAPGEPMWNSPARARSGLLFSGFSADHQFIGIGQFDMRSR